jgi:hypothetical protein
MNLAIALPGAVAAIVLGLAQPVGAVPADGVPYAQVKRAVAAVRATESAAVASGPYEISCDPFQDFTGAMYGDRAEMTVERYADVADRVLGLEADLPRIGYPERVWSAWLSRYESGAIVERAPSPVPSAIPTGLGLGGLGLSGISRPHVRLSGFEGLRDLLTSYRRSHRHARHVILGACVDAEAERAVPLVTQPAASHVFVIPSFFYELCRVRKVDPEDTMRCAHWREVASRVVPMSGSYHYIAKWADGTTARGILDKEDASSDAITLRKP